MSEPSGSLLRTPVSMSTHSVRAGATYPKEGRLEYGEAEAGLEGEGEKCGRGRECDRAAEDAHLRDARELVGDIRGGEAACVATCDVARRRRGPRAARYAHTHRLVEE